MAFIAVSLQIFWFFFLQKCSLSSPLRTIWILSKPLNLIGCHGNLKAKFLKKYSKIFSSEAIRGMKLKLCINVHDISLYINFVFYCRCPCAFVGMATLSFHRLIMEKVKVGLYFFLTVDMLTKVLQSCSLLKIWILFKLLLWLVAMAAERLNLQKNIQKSSFHKGDEAETLHNCSWY